MNSKQHAMTTSLDQELIADLKGFCGENRYHINAVIAALMKQWLAAQIEMPPFGLMNPKRKTITTSIDLALQTQFKAACAQKKIKMNDAIERLIVLLLADHFAQHDGDFR